MTGMGCESMDGANPRSDERRTGLIGGARDVAVRLKAAAQRIDAARELPPDMVGALHDARLFRLLLPRSVGGEEIDLPTFAAITEIIAEADASAAWCVGQGGGCAMSAAYLEPDAARRLFGPANAVLAWGAGAQGRAVATEGGYRMTGSWGFASGSRHATLIGAHCKLFATDGTPQTDTDGRQIELTGLITRDKIRFHDNWQVLGLRGTGSDSYSIDDLFVPKAEAFIRVETHAYREPGTLYRFPAMNAYAGAFAGVMLGIARGALSDLKQLAATKSPRGAPSSLRDSQVFQSELAILEARLRSARLLHMTTLETMWGEVDAGRPLTLDRRIDARLASTFAINEGHDIVTKVYRAAGQNAIFDLNPFERRLRDANAASQQVQGRPGHFTTVGRHLLGLAPDTMMFL